jgi:hypothetical protein
MVLHQQMPARQQSRHHDVQHGIREMHSHAHVGTKASAESRDLLEGKRRLESCRYADGLGRGDQM